MPTLPYLAHGNCTKSDSSAYSSSVWITNETTNERDSVTAINGKYLYDLANLPAQYSTDDIITIGIIGFANPGYILTSKPFEDSPVDTIDFDGQRLNTGTLTVNFKVGYGVSKNKARVEVYKKFYDLLNGNLPTYLDKDDETITYSIFSAFPEVSPVFPCLVIPSIEKDTMRLGVDLRPNVSLPSSIDIEFYAKTKDGKNAIDKAKDHVQMIIENNWVTESFTVTGEGGQQQDIQGIE